MNKNQLCLLKTQINKNECICIILNNNLIQPKTKNKYISFGTKNVNFDCCYKYAQLNK